MLGKNLLWVAKQHAHGVEVMLLRVVLRGLVDDPEVPSPRCFRVWQCNVKFQPLEGNLITLIVETNNKRFADFAIPFAPAGN